MIKFFALKLGTPKFGPFYPVPQVAINTGTGNVVPNLVAPWGFTAPPSDVDRNHSQRFQLIQGLRSAVFPGVLQIERPARGSLTPPAQAAITNHSTLTLNDGSARSFSNS